MNIPYFGEEQEAVIGTLLLSKFTKYAPYAQK